MRVALVPVALAVALSVILPVAPAQAGTSFEFLFDITHVGDDNQYFLNLTVGRYGYDRPDLDPFLPRLRSVDNDLPVVLFLAHQTGRPLGFIVDLRARGLSWSVVFTRLNVSPAVLFVGIDRDPGPPYGKAWGYWKRHPKGYQFTDNDIAGLVKIQIGARYARMSPFELAQARGKGRRVQTFVAEKKGRPYKPKGEKPAKGGPQGAAEQGKGKGHGQNHESGPEKSHGPHR